MSKSAPSVPAAEVSESDRLRAIIRALEDDGGMARAKLAVLIRLGDAAADEPDAQGLHGPLDQLMWRGVSDIARDVLRVLESIERLAETESQFVYDTKDGGAR